MNKLILLGLAATLGAANLALAPQGASVNLQATSPGTAQTGHLNISGTATVGLLKSKGTVFGEATSPTGFSYGGFFTAASNQARGFYGYASSPTGLTYGGFFQNASDQGRAVYGLNTAATGTTFGGYFQTASPTGRGVFGVATATSGIGYGVYGRAYSPNGYGVYSQGNLGASGVISGNGSGLTELNASSLASGSVMDTLLPDTIARRNADNRFTGANEFIEPLTLGGYLANARIEFPSGFKLGLDSNGHLAMTGSAQYNSNLLLAGKTIGIGYSDSYPTNGVARLAVAETIDIGTFATLMTVNGYRPAGFNAQKRGIFGSASGLGTGSGATFVAESSNAISFGVEGHAIGQSTNYGVYGYAYGPGQNYGVYGYASGGTGYAGFFSGLLHSSSSSASVKAFMIDHPMDPANKVLTHSSIESDERMNVYRGAVRTDSSGFAIITLPSWFDALNEDIQYQLTVIGDESTDFVLVKVAKELHNGKFKIRTSVPGTKVNWQVTGRRHDPASNYYPLEVERMKSKDERGKYYVPEAYGKDRTFGVGYIETTSSSTRPTADR